MSATRSSSPTDYALLLALAAIWGSSFLFIKLGVATIPPLTITAARMTIATVELAVAAWIARETLPGDARTWALIAGASLAGNAIPFTLIGWGEETIDSGIAAILMAVMPLTTVLLAHVFDADDRLTWRKAAGVALGFCGLAVLIGPDALTHLGADAVRQLAIALAAMFYGVAAVIARRLAHLPPLVLTAAIAAISAAVMLPVSLIHDAPFSLAPSATSLGAVAILGAVHTGFAVLIMFAILRRRGAGFFSQINFLVPVFGVFWGAALLGEEAGASAYAALAVILAGIALAGRGARAAATAPVETPRPGA